VSTTVEAFKQVLLTNDLFPRLGIAEKRGKPGITSVCGALRAAVCATSAIRRGLRRWATQTCRARPYW
jgi:hypothetical protein